MTRREELEEKAKALVESWKGGLQPMQHNITKALLQVERECWQRAEEKIEQLMEKEHASTDDQIWEYRDWCRAQKEGV